MKPSLALAALGIGLATRSAAASQRGGCSTIGTTQTCGDTVLRFRRKRIPKENGTPASFYEAREHDPADGRPLHPQLIEKGEEVDVIADLVPLGGGTCQRPRNHVEQSPAVVRRGFPSRACSD